MTRVERVLLKCHELCRTGWDHSSQGCHHSLIVITSKHSNLIDLVVDFPIWTSFSQVCDIMERFPTTIARRRRSLPSLEINLPGGEWLCAFYRRTCANLSYSTSVHYTLEPSLHRALEECVAMGSEGLMYVRHFGGTFYCRHVSYFWAKSKWKVDLIRNHM